MPNLTIFQEAIIEAQRKHQTIKSKTIGKTAFDKWTAICAYVGECAYTAWKDTHDNMGHDVPAVDESTVRAHREAVVEALTIAMTSVGEVAFKDREAAMLKVNAALIDSVISLSFVAGWKYSTNVETLDKHIADAKYDVQEAKKEFARYDFNGVNEEAKAAKQKTLEDKTAILDALRAQRKAAVGELDGKVRQCQPKDADVFRMDFECAIKDMITGQQAMTFDEWKAKREAIRKARRERTHAKKNAAK